MTFDVPIQVLDEVPRVHILEVPLLLLLLLDQLDLRMLDIYTSLERLLQRNFCELLLLLLDFFERHFIIDKAQIFGKPIVRFVQFLFDGPFDITILLNRQGFLMTRQRCSSLVTRHPAKCIHLLVFCCFASVWSLIWIISFGPCVIMSLAALIRN